MSAKPNTPFPGIRAEEIPRWGQNIEVGPDVEIDCRRLLVGDRVKIGMGGENDFRLPGGVRIRVDELVVEDEAHISRQVMMRGGSIRLGPRVTVAHNVTINVKGRLVIGSHGTVNEGAEISGVDIEIGRELWMLPQAKIGGGSAFEVHSSLRIGHWCHLGVRSLLNTARLIVIGDEVGLGTGTSLYTHGAYPSALEGKPAAFGPIQIGDRSWLPGAIVNPSVTIGKDCIVGVGSVVTRNLPDGCLAAGAPAKIIKENVYPRPLGGATRVEFYREFLRTFAEICGARSTYQEGEGFASFQVKGTRLLYKFEIDHRDFQDSDIAHVIVVTDQLKIDSRALPRNVTVLDCAGRKLHGAVVPLSERLLNQLRRYGVRFNYDAEDGKYVPWA